MGVSIAASKQGGRDHRQEVRIAFGAGKVREVDLPQAPGKGTSLWAEPSEANPDFCRAGNNGV